LIVNSLEFSFYLVMSTYRCPCCVPTSKCFVLNSIDRIILRHSGEIKGQPALNLSSGRCPLSFPLLFDTKTPAPPYASSNLENLPRPLDFFTESGGSLQGRISNQSNNRRTTLKRQRNTYSVVPSDPSPILYLSSTPQLPPLLCLDDVEKIVKFGRFLGFWVAGASGGDLG
jgi:hypothetical protein